MHFQFVLFEFVRYEGAWWVQIGGFCFDDLDPAVFHLEHNQGVWKVDVLGLRCLYYWWRER